MIEQPTMAGEALTFQMLTPARLRWVLDIGESTEAEWREQKAIEFFNRGRVIRYTPASVLEFIARNSRKARGATLPIADCRLPIAETDWARIERLISDQIEAHGLKPQYGVKVAA
jgi:hypothetical protein